MTDERAGQLNEESIVKSVADRLTRILGYREDAGVPAFISFRETAMELVKRGLINELGIEILKRDGVIK